MSIRSENWRTLAMRIGRDAVGAWNDARAAQARYLGLRIAMDVASSLTSQSADYEYSELAEELGAQLAEEVSNGLVTVHDRAHPWEAAEIEALCRSALSALRPHLEADHFFSISILEPSFFSDDIDGKALGAVISELVEQADDALSEMGFE